MFVLEFEKPLFEFAYERPHCDLLLALPPTFSSSMMYHLFFTHSMVVENLIARKWVVYIFCASANPIIRRFQLCSFNLAFYIMFINSLFLYSSLADVQPTLCVVSHRHELRTAHDCRVAVESQASADRRPRVRETAVRARIRKTAMRQAVSDTPNVQQLATCRSP